MMPLDTLSSDIHEPTMLGSGNTLWNLKQETFVHRKCSFTIGQNGYLPWEVVNSPLKTSDYSWEWETHHRAFQATRTLWRRHGWDPTPDRSLSELAVALPFVEVHYSARHSPLSFLWKPTALRAAFPKCGPWMTGPGLSQCRFPAASPDLLNHQFWFWDAKICILKKISKWFCCTLKCVSSYMRVEVTDMSPAVAVFKHWTSTASVMKLWAIAVGLEKNLRRPEHLQKPLKICHLGRVGGFISPRCSCLWKPHFISH